MEITKLDDIIHDWNGISFCSKQCKPQKPKGHAVVKHEAIWAAIDKLAEVNGFTPCGLARAAGLDVTSFNPSKRFARGNHLRWPTLETINKILDATNTTLADFVAMVPENPEPIKSRTRPGRATSKK